VGDQKRKHLGLELTGGNTMQKSDFINELATSLAKAQGSITTASKDKQNPFLKSSYADLASVMAAARAHLSANGLSVIQTAETDDTGGVSVTTMLAHASGQWISGTMSMTAGEERGKSSAQVLGSIVTYLRRYGYMAITGVVADDDDDDGNSATGKPAQSKPAAQAAAPKPATVQPDQEEDKHWFDVAGTNKAVAGWLNSTFKGATIESVHDAGKKMHDFATKAEFVEWAKAYFGGERAQVEQLVGAEGGVVQA
jgi:hypothetical protein